MTGPLGGESLGDAYINVHADTSDVEGDLDKGLAKAGKDSEPGADKVGKDLGTHIGDSVEKEVARHGPDIAHTLGKEVEKEVVDVAPNFRYNVRGKNGRFVKQTAEGIASEVEDAFARSVSSSGIFGKIGQAVSDAIGSGFNVPGKSPLIVALVPVIGAIVGLVGALLQAINAVAATLTTIPALFAAIGLQAGVLVLAFKGVGTAISGAFAATNADELAKALVDLTPAAKAFVVSLLPLKNLFSDLKQVTQENFFKALGDSVTKVINNVEPLLRRSFGDLATALGGSVAAILAAFSGPEFHDFIATVIPATTEWIKSFGPAFAQFLIGLINLGTAATPFLSLLGKLLNAGLASLGKNLTDLSNDKGFTDWLARMYKTLLTLGPLVKSVFNFIVTFLDQLDKAGGKALITSLTSLLVQLTNFFASEIGLRALNETIGIAIALMYVLVLSAEAVIFLFASIDAFIAWFVNTAVPAVIKAFDWFGITVANIVKTILIGLAVGVLGFIALLDWLGISIANIIKAIGGFFADFAAFIWHWVLSTRQSIVDFFENLWRSINDGKGRLLLAVTQLPGQIRDALGNLGRLLLNAGHDLIQGLIDGINNAIPALRSVLGFITRLLPDWKGPEDKDKKILKPAGEAVMAGFGAGILAGAQDIQAMLADFTSGLGGVAVSQPSTHILFGAGAMQLNFQGALPTANQAMAIGQAVGTGVNSQLAARDTRLAVRTL